MDSLLRIVNILFVMLAIWQSKVIFELTHQNSNTTRNSGASEEAPDRISQIQDSQHKLDQQIKDADRDRIRQQQMEFNTLLGISKIKMAGAEIITETKRSNDLESIKTDIDKLKNNGLTMRNNQRSSASELEQTPQRIIQTRSAKSRPYKVVTNTTKVEIPSNSPIKILDDRHQISDYITPPEKKSTAYSEDMGKSIKKIHPADPTQPQP
jgi:hypothetical protein